MNNEALLEMLSEQNVQLFTQIISFLIILAVDSHSCYLRCLILTHLIIKLINT